MLYMLTASAQLAWSEEHVYLPAAGSGKTHIAAQVIQEQHLPAAAAAKAAGHPKAIVFLAPTNPLVAQVCSLYNVSSFDPFGWWHEAESRLPHG
jgi:ERCC4-related helicase